MAAPTDILVTGSNIREAAPAGTLVATLSAVDPDMGDTFSYAITADPSGFFVVLGNGIRVTPGANLDFETLQQHIITVEVTDSTSDTYSEPVIIQLLDMPAPATIEFFFTTSEVPARAAP